MLLLRSTAGPDRSRPASGRQTVPNFHVFTQSEPPRAHRPAPSMCRTKLGPTFSPDQSPGALTQDFCLLRVLCNKHTPGTHRAAPRRSTPQPRKLSQTSPLLWSSSPAVSLCVSGSLGVPGSPLSAPGLKLSVSRSLHSTVAEPSRTEQNRA